MSSENPGPRCQAQLPTHNNPLTWLVPCMKLADLYPRTEPVQTIRMRNNRAMSSLLHPKQR